MQREDNQVDVMIDAGRDKLSSDVAANFSARIAQLSLGARSCSPSMTMSDEQASYLSHNKSGQLRAQALG